MAILAWHLLVAWGYVCMYVRMHVCMYVMTGLWDYCYFASEPVYISIMQIVFWVLKNSYILNAII